MNLVLDTGIYLSFYHYTDDDLAELDKLVKLVESGTVILHLPDQVTHDDISRRETKFADALKRLSDLRLEGSFPRIF